MITGILAPSEATIEINGKDIQKEFRLKPSASSVLYPTTRMRFFASGELNI